LGKGTWPYLTGDHQNGSMPYLFEDIRGDSYEQRGRTEIHLCFFLNTSSTFYIPAHTCKFTITLKV